MGQQQRSIRICSGKYLYRNYLIINHGYSEAGELLYRGVLWEAVNKDTGCADYHASTKYRILEMIDQDLSR
jgi:hypothetical protein